MEEKKLTIFGVELRGFLRYLLLFALGIGGLFGLAKGFVSLLAQFMPRESAMDVLAFLMILAGLCVAAYSAQKLRQGLLTEDLLTQDRRERSRGEEQSGDA